jgi:hypothetical protein
MTTTTRTRTRRPVFRVKRDGWWKLQEILSSGPQEFNPDSASLRGRWIDGPLMRISDTWLRDEALDEFIRDRGLIDFVIYSYRTPIAWHVVSENCVGPGHWVMPNTKYSVTTSSHQGQVGTALSQI